MKKVSISVLIIDVPAAIMLIVDISVVRAFLLNISLAIFAFIIAI